MIVSVASGKGGTGKTTVAVNLALAIGRREKVLLIDADVEEPNVHVFLEPTVDQKEPVSLPVPEVDKGRCTFCGRCAEVCAYGAITVIKGAVIVFEDLCHGCGGCALLCPEKAITERPRPIGVVERGRADGLAVVQGRLNPGEALSPPVTRAAKRDAGAPGRITIIDAPPGTACPAVEAVRGSDLCLLVTEPTPFGLHDLFLATEMARKLGLKVAALVNRADLGDDRVDRFCEREGLPVVDRFPNDLKLAAAYARGQPAVAVFPGWRRRFERLADRLPGLVAEA